jgi:hypothetical protein
VVIALYERGEGMDYAHIQNFAFELFEEKASFRLADFTSTDGFINKYPPRSGDPGPSDIGVYYYTYRDINSLRRNAGFMTAPHYNGIVVQLTEFYKYAYLHAFKRLFTPQNIWLYGNLSPLLAKTWLESSKRELVMFALLDHPALVQLSPNLRTRIAEHYNVDLANPACLGAGRASIESEIMKLASV